MGCGAPNPVDHIGNAISGIAKGVGHTIENIGRNPLPIILAVAITVGTGGLGAGAAAAELAGFTAAETAIAGSAGSMIAAATNAAIANAAIAAVNGGDISKIATAGIIGGITAGIANGIPASEVLQNVTEGMDAATRKIIESSAGRSVSSAVGAVLQGRDPFTGALSGAVSGALSSSLSDKDLGDLNKAAANIIGSTGAAAAVAGVTGKDIDKAIANSASYGIVNSALSGALGSFNTAKEAYQSTADKINPLIEQANELYKTAAEQKATAEEKNAEIDPQMEQAKADYYAAKDARDTAGMTAAAAKFNELNTIREQNLAEFNQTNSQLADLKTKIDPLNEQIVQQKTAMLDANTKLDSAYGNFAEKTQALTERQGDIIETTEKLPKYYQDIYNKAVAEGKDGDAAVSAAIKEYAPQKQVAENQLGDLPVEYRAMFQSELLNGVPPEKALADVQAAKAYNVMQDPTENITAANEKPPEATVEGVYRQNPNTGLWSVVGKDPNGNDITLVPLAQGSGAPLVEGAAAGKFNLFTDPNNPDAFTAQAVPEAVQKPGLEYSTNPDTGQITVTNADGTKDIYDKDGNLVSKTTVDETTGKETTNPFNFNVNNLLGTFKVSAASKAPTTGGGTTIPPTTGGGTTTPPTTGGGTTTPPTTSAPVLSAPIADIQHLAPGLVKGSSFKFADTPDFQSGINTVQQTMPFDYSSQIFNAAKGGLIQAFASGEDVDTVNKTEVPNTALSPKFVRGSKFGFSHTPHFESALNQLANPIPMDYSKQILAASGIEPIQHMAEGESVQTPESPSPTLRPTFMHGHPLQRFARFRPAQFGQYETKEYAEGGDVEGHDPQFFSEGGLQSLQNTYVKGPGDGTSDSVPAMLANGEFVIPADVVSKLGNGSNDAGADALSQMLVSIRKHAQNHDPKKLPPKSKGALAYLLNAKRKVG
jgi:predicted  nucleic acid-binding Zn-ribbon protein